MLRVTIWMASLASLLSTAHAQQEALVRSLRPLWPASVQAPAMRATAVPNENYGGPYPRDAGFLAERETGWDWLESVLRERHRDALDADRLHLQVQEPHDITFTGDANAVDACAADFDALAAAFGRTVELTAYRLPLADGELPAPFLDGKALRELLEGTTAIWTSRARVRSGATVVLEDATWHGYARDIDVEVAEKAKIADPKMDQLFAGTRVQATLHALPGDRLLLHGSWLVSRLVELREQSVGSDGPTIDLPHVHTLHATFAGQIENGHALAVAGRGEGPEGQQLLLVVTARYLAPAPALPAGLCAVPITAWQDEMQARATPRPIKFPGDDWPGPESERRLLAPADVSSLLGDVSTAHVAAGHLIWTGDPARIEAARDALARISLAQSDGYALRMTRDGTAGQGAVTLVQPVLANHPSHAFLGSERSIVRDHEVEIAAKAAMSNPVVDTSRSGLWSWCTVAPGHGDGDDFVDGIWRSAQQRPARLRSFATEPTMLVECNETRTSTWPWSGAAPTDRELELSPGVRLQLVRR